MSREKASRLSGKGIAFVAFPFFTDQENRALQRLQGLRSARLAEELKDLENGEILGTRITDLQEEEFAFQLSELLRHQVREQNQIGIESVKTVLTCRQKGLSGGERQAALEQLDEWKAYQEAWAIQYYDDYTDQDQDGDDNRERIKSAVWYGIEIAKRELQVVADSVQGQKQTPESEHPSGQTVSQADAARLLAKHLGIGKNRGNVYNMCQPGKRTAPRLEMTPDGRITEVSLYKHIAGRKHKAAPMAPSGTRCPRCAADVWKPIGPNRVCKNCFEKELLGPT